VTTVARSDGSRWRALLRGHLLLFDQRREPVFSADAGARLLIAAALLELLRLAMVRWLHPGIPLLLLMAFLLGAALVAPRLARLRLSQLGLLRWRAWSLTEKAYFIEVVILANVVFPLVLAAPLAARLAQRGAMGTHLGVFLPFLLFGFYQELVYRGMVQLELVRRWGAVAGILAANGLYTFGPLHAEYFSARPSLAVPMFAAIFAMGLFFGLVYRRSGNLWIPAVFHAIGNAYVVTALDSVR